MKPKAKKSKVKAKTKTLVQPAIAHTWKHKPEAADTSIGPYHKMREWQRECFKQLKDQRHWILNAPTASGKSFEICALLHNQLKANPKIKAIITVPQTIIASSFRSNQILMPTGAKVDWNVPENHDLCRGQISSNIRRLEEFLLEEPSKTDLMERIMVCSQATVVRAFQKNPSAFKNLQIIIDEAHHSQYDEDLGLTNQLGAIIRHSLSNKKLNIGIGLVTATFFRGDRSAIVSDQYQSSFTRYDLPYDEYLQTCKYLRGFNYNFMLYERKNVIAALKQAFKDGIKKTLVYVPPVLSGSSLGSKYVDVQAIYRAIANSDKPQMADLDKPIIRIRRGKQWIKVVNLVDERRRDEKKEAVIAAHNHKDDSLVDVVIALGMLKEGANWRWANRELIIGPRGSLTDITQMIGRLFRDVKGKSSVEVLHLLQNPKEDKKALNEYLLAILATMLHEDVLEPLPPPSQASVGKPSMQRVDYLMLAVGDANKALEIRLAIELGAGEILESKEFKDLASRRQAFNKAVSDILTKHGIKEYHNQIAYQIGLRSYIRSQRMSGLAVSDLDFEVLKDSWQPSSALLQYTSQACKVSTFASLRNCFGMRSKQFIAFSDAKRLVCSLGISSLTEYTRSYQRGLLPGCPATPDRIYSSSGWSGWKDFFGTSLLSYRDAKAAALRAGITTSAAYKTAVTKGILLRCPKNPDQYYRSSGWTSWADFLDIQKRVPESWGSLRSLRALLKRHKISSYTEYHAALKRGSIPGRYPVDVKRVYGLTLNQILGRFRYSSLIPFSVAKRLVRPLHIKSSSEYRLIKRQGRLPDKLVAEPHKTYRDKGWRSWRDFLGYDTVHRPIKEFLPKEDAIAFVRSLQLPSRAAYMTFHKHSLSGMLPVNAAHYYKVSWPELLGTQKKNAA